MFCGKCGNKVKKNSEYCKVCGTQLNTSSEENKNTSVGAGNNNKNITLIIIICILLAIIVAGVVIFVIKPGKKSNNNANDSETSGSTYTEESTPGGVTNPEEANNTLTIRVCGANFGTDDEGVLSDAVVSLYEGYDNYEGEPLYQLHSDGSGYCAFENLAGNEYAVKIECSGYEQHLSNVTVGEAGNITKYLVPIPGDNDVIFEVIWDGEHDLDLCSFNASTGEYTSVGNPMDSFGSFIYSDNSDRKYELIYLRDYASDNVRTIYVVDTSALNQGLSSTMEADGVILRAYTSSGKCFEKKAESSKSASVWTVAYIYNGAVYDDAEAYIDNVTSDGDYAWAYNLKSGNVASDDSDKNNPPVASNEASWKALYYDLLKSKYQKYEYCDEYGVKAENKFTLCYMDGDDIPELICLKVYAIDEFDENEYVYGSHAILNSVQKNDKGELNLITNGSYITGAKDFSSLSLYDNRLVTSYHAYRDIPCYAYSIELKNGSFEEYAHFISPGDGTYDFYLGTGEKENGDLRDIDEEECVDQIYGNVNGKTPKETKLTSYNYDQILDILSK